MCELKILCIGIYRSKVTYLLILRFKNQGLKMIAFTLTSLMYINWRMIGGIGSTQVIYAFVILGSIWATLKVIEAWSNAKTENNN